MNYTLNQLRVYLKVVETESVTRASEELFMTQPAVSIQLKNFQEQFSIPLTELIGRKLFITDFGREIAEMASRILTDIEELKFKTRAYEGLITGKLKISSASTGKYVTPYFLSGFLNENPAIDLKLDVTNKSLVIESLKKNEIEFAVVSVLPVDIEVEEELLIENRLYFVAPTTSSNYTETLIFREPGSATRVEMENFFKQKKSNDQKKLELTSNEAVKQAVISGLGSSILPLIGIKNELANGDLKIVEIKGLPLKTEWRLIWLKQKKLSPVGLAFLSYLRENKVSILREHFGWYMEA